MFLAFIFFSFHLDVLILFLNKSFVCIKSFM